MVLDARVLAWKRGPQGRDPDSVSRRVVREGAHKAANEMYVPCRNAAAPPQASPAGERPHGGDVMGTVNDMLERFHGAPA